MVKSSTKATPKSKAKAAPETEQPAQAADEKTVANPSPADAPAKEETNDAVANSAGSESRTDQSEQGDGGIDPNPRGAAVAIDHETPKSVTLSFPLPDGATRDALKAASIVVKAKPQQGRWRAGRFFTRDETLIPYVDLDDDKIAALTGDPELIVSLRIAEPD